VLLTGTKGRLAGSAIARLAMISIRVWRKLAVLSSKNCEFLSILIVAIREASCSESAFWGMFRFHRVCRF
jgi:hypothetical protein